MSVRNSQHWRLEDHACAKINLALEVHGRAGDGYHDIRTVMVSLALADDIQLEAWGKMNGRQPRIELTLQGDDDDVPRDESNLAVRAATLYTGERNGTWPQVIRVRLVKRVPSQAGLGGGSADAGTVLRLLGQVPGRPPVSIERLQMMATRLGSDVPFAVTGGAAIAEGRGERLRPIRAPSGWWVVLVQPAERLSTAWCYQRWDTSHSDVSSGRASPKPFDRASPVDVVAAALERGDLAGVAENLYNDLQGPVYGLYPHLREIPSTLTEAGCVGASMTGSGSCFFGLAATRALARQAAAAARARMLGRVWITKTWRETS